MNINLRLLYLYLFSFVGLLIAVIGSVQIVDLGLKTFIFRNADREYYQYAPRIAPDGTAVPVETNEQELKTEQQAMLLSNRERETANALAMILVGIPLYWYHWRLVQKEKK